MDKDFLSNSNIEIEVEDGNKSEPQFISVETFKEEAADSMDITDCVLVSEEEVDLNEYQEQKNSIHISEDVTKSTAKEFNSNKRLKVYIKPEEHLQLTSINDGQSVFIIENVGESAIKSTVTTEKVLHSGHAKANDPREKICSYDGVNPKKISTPVLLNKLLKPPNKLSNQSGQVSTVKQKTPIPSETKSSPIVHAMSSTVQKYTVTRIPAQNQQGPFLEVDTSRINPCVIPGCVIYKNEKVYAFKVPQDIDLLNIWNLCIDMEELKSLGFNDVICYKHFHESDVVHNFKMCKEGNTEVLVDEPYLKKGSMPCISYHLNCCIPDCTMSSKNMFTFPILNKHNLHLWLYMVKDPSLKQLPVRELLKHRMCEMHFEKDCFDKLGGLTEHAAPTLNLSKKTICFDGTTKSLVYCESGTTKCVFKNCKSGITQAGRFILPLPCKDFSSTKKWLQACERSDLITESFDSTLQNIKGFGICNDHFLPQDFENVSMSTLKPDVLPRSTKHHIVVHKACAFRLCFNLNKQFKKVYPFPEERERLRSWLQVVAREDLCKYNWNLEVNLDYYGICEDHFFKSDFMNGELLPNAIPKNVVKFLGSNFKVHLAFPRNGEESSTKKSSGNKEDSSIMTVERPRVQQISSFIQPVKILPDMCLYRGCKSKPSALNPFFELPLNKSQYRVWLRACGYKTEGVTSSSIRYKICGKHFKNNPFDETGRFVERLATPVQYKTSKLVDPPEYVRRSYSKPRDIGKTKTVSEGSSMAATSVSEISNQGTNGFSGESKEHDGEYMECADDVPMNDIELEMLCAVENCITLYKGADAIAHKFPHPDNQLERFEIWRRLVANESLDPLTRDDVHRTYVVCERHFEPYFYMQKLDERKLRDIAVPTLNLPGNSEWLKETVYYQEIISPCLEEMQVDVPAQATTWVGSEPVKISDLEDKTRCILEKDRLRFPGMGCFLQLGDNRTSKRNISKIPYTVYKSTKLGYGRSNSEYGENFRIHTAIIIDDDDESEKLVLRYLLNKRNAAVNAPTKNSMIS